MIDFHSPISRLNRRELGPCPFLYGTEGVSILRQGKEVLTSNEFDVPLGYCQDTE